MNIWFLIYNFILHLNDYTWYSEYSGDYVKSDKEGDKIQTLVLNSELLAFDE